MRCYVLLRILITCAVTFINIGAWNLRKSELDLDLALQGDLNGQNICDDKKFPPNKRKKVCQIATKAAKGKKPIFEKIFLKNGDKHSYQCHEKLVHFIHTQPAPRERLMFLCETDTDDKYYFGTGKNVDEVALYIDPIDKSKIPIEENEVEAKTQRENRSSVEVDESGVSIRSGDESSAVEDAISANTKRKGRASFEDSEDAEYTQHKNKSDANKEDDICEEIKEESSIDIDKSSICIEHGKKLPQVIFYGVMEDIDLETFHSIRHKIVHFIKKWI